MGFTNAILVHIHEKTEEEVGMIKQLLKDTTQRVAFFPSSSSNININLDSNNRNRLKESAKQRRSRSHDYEPTMKTVQSFSSHDEEMIERLVELQN